MMKFDEELEIYYSDKLSPARFIGGFATRAQGDGRRKDSLVNFFYKAEIDYKRLITPEQVHSANIEIITEGSPDTAAETDGLLTDLSQTVLTMISADCVPILFADSSNNICAISHQGWRGSLKRIQQKMIDKIEELGGNVQNIIAAIGPAIGDCCYNVAEDRFEQFADEAEVYLDRIFLKRGGSYYLNLALFNYLLLVDRGVRRENIDFFPFCTSCNSKRFYSSRRINKKDFSRQFSFILQRPI